MRVWRTRLQFFGAAIALSATWAAPNLKGPISVVAQPMAQGYILGGKVAVKALVTNNSRREIWFTSCPDPYTVELTDAKGHSVPRKRPPEGSTELLVCGMNILFTIIPGQTWTTNIDLDEMFELKAETYQLRLLWHFPWNVRKTDDGTDWDTLTVSSNSTSLTISR